VFECIVQKAFGLQYLLVMIEVINIRVKKKNPHFGCSYLFAYETGLRLFGLLDQAQLSV
jgi:hypothetical protein